MHKSLMFGDELLAHLKSHQRCSAGIRCPNTTEVHTYKYIYYTYSAAQV